MRTQYIKSGQGFVVMYDVTTKSTFDDVKTFVDFIKQVKQEEDVAVLLIGNKSDLPNRQVTYEEGAALAKQYNFPFLECSAKEDTNVTEMFTNLAKLVSKKTSVSASKKQSRRRCTIQ